MAQRQIGMHGPELWLVTGKPAEVRLGPPLRDLPQADDRATALVQRASGCKCDATVTLLVVHDGCIVGPWVPAEVRHSKEHVVCVTNDVLATNESVPVQCSAGLMGALSRYAKHRLQAENTNVTGVQLQHNAEAELQNSPMSQVDSEGHHQPTPSVDDDYSPRPVAELSQCSAVEDQDDWSEADDEEQEEWIPSSEESEADETAPYEERKEELDAPFSHSQSPVRTRPAGEGDDDASQRSRGSDELATSSGCKERIPSEEHAALEVGTGPRTGDDVGERTCANQVDSVVSADQLVRAAREAWMQTKEPSRYGSCQQLILRQEGTDLRDLRAGPADPDEGGASGMPSRARVAASDVHSQGAEGPRARWGVKQPVAVPVVRSSRTSHQQLATPGRAAAVRRFKSASQGGPAGLVASSDHLQRLEQLQARTAQVQAIWQRAGVVEAFRALMKFDDAALSVSVLHAVMDWLPTLQAPECAVALALASPLLTPPTAASVLAPLTILLRTTLEPVPVNSTDDASQGAASAATLAAVRSNLSREMRVICGRLDELRVPRGSGPRSAGHASTFDEQFAFGQALALAREMAREAWRRLDGGSEVGAPPMHTRTTEHTVAPGGGRPAQATSGRRAW